MSERFIKCYPADGMMWCQHPNGSWAPPFPLNRDRQKTKTSFDKEVNVETSSKKENVSELNPS